jgi:nucleotide-binding universal stress UspA family protein
MYRRVLVPLDGSRLAEGILPFVLQIAGPLDLEVALVRVVEPIMTQTLEGTGHAPVDDADLRSRGVRVTTDARHGEPLAELLAAARDSRADLIAMTTHGRSGLGRLLFGSIAEAVLRRAQIPVLTMRLTRRQVAVPEVA